MDSNVRDCLVTGYDSLIPFLKLPDPDDCHVLAAAIKGQVDVIVTKNLKDFPSHILDNYEVAAEHPDEFISNLIDLKPLLVTKAAETCRKRLKKPPKSIDEYLENLLKQELPITVSMLRELCYEV